MTRTRLSLFSTTALATTLGVALPAFAQAPAQMYAPAPAPMYAPAPAPAPMYAPAPVMAPAPAPEVAVIPAAPVAVAPKAADDMTGSVGFGVGISAGTIGTNSAGDSTGSLLIAPDTGNLMMKYWLSDALALVPRLGIGISKRKDVDAAWSIAPQILADFTLLKGASTRLSAGVGLGLGFYKDPNAITPQVAGGDPTKTFVDIYVPVQIGVEHFFTLWFAMGIAADFALIDFEKQGTPWTLDVSISNTHYLGSLFFYTD